MSAKRILKACDQCRSKKIKCDGLEVCSKCSIKGVECTYYYVHKQRIRKDTTAIEKPKRRRGRPKKIVNTPSEAENDSSSPSEGAFALEDRLAKMENMMSVLIDKVSSSSSFQPTLTKNMDNKDSYLALPFPIRETSSGKSSISTGTSKSMLSSEKRNTTEHVVSVVYESGMFLQTSMFILSPPGIKWVESTLKNSKTVSPLIAIIKFAAPFEKKLLSEWVNPIDQSKLNPLPESTMIKELVSYLKLSICMNRVIDMDYLEKLFEDYCNFRDGMIPEPEFTYGDYLLMNSSLLVGCSTLVEFINTDINSPTGFSVGDIKKIEHMLFDNSIFYYHRCSVISHGLASVSGCISLAFYADSISLSRAAFLIGSTAIRQAQQMGLHREESYRGLSQTERSIRLKIWWTNYIFDKEMCFRWGHSPVINDDDVSAPPLPGTEAFWSFNERNSVKTRGRMVYEIQAMLDGLTESENFIDLDLYINVDYAFIISDVYRTLFSANSIRKKSAENILATRDSLFKDLDMWRNTLPLKLRPQHQYSQEFREEFTALKNDISPSSIYWVIMISSYNIRYHHLRMIIGRTTSHFLCELENKDPDLRMNPSHLKFGLESARAVMEMACMVDSRFGNYANYLIFYPFNAFLTICAYYIYKCDSDDDLVKADLELLMNSVIHYFNPFSDDAKRSEKGWLFSAVVKCMLYITIQSIKDRGNEVNYSKEFLSQCDKIFDPIKAFLAHNIKIDDLVLTVRNKMRLLDVSKRNVATLPVNFKSSAQFSSPDQGSIGTPQSGDFLAGSILNDGRIPQQQQQQQTHIERESAHLPVNIESEITNDWNVDGAELFFQNMLNIPNYMMDFGFDK